MPEVLSPLRSLTFCGVIGRAPLPPFYSNERKGKVFGNGAQHSKNSKRSVCICMYRFTKLGLSPFLSTFFQEKNAEWDKKQCYMSFKRGRATLILLAVDSSNCPKGVIEVLECTRCINGINRIPLLPLFFVHRCDSVIPLRRSKWQLWCLLVPATFFHCRALVLQYSHRDCTRVAV